MVLDMETQYSTHRVGRGSPIGSDGIWLQGPTVHPPVGRGLDSTLANQWAKRRRDLAEHLSTRSAFVRVHVAAAATVSFCKSPDVS